MRTREEKIEYCKKWRELNKEKVKAYNKEKYLKIDKEEKRKYEREYKNKNRDKINKNGLLSKAKRKLKDPEGFKRKMKHYWYNGNYNISLEDYEKMLQEQNECCSICGKHYSKFKKALHVDHNHETGEVRELLCTKCNNGIGLLKESIDNIKKCINYLKDNNE